ncbi:MAG TPA: DNA repair protein RadC [Candidatus Saccharimonadales bacterium]|nr:DNA repair protein RadC [Candidatus Saccharimonadales bacterium]
MQDVPLLDRPREKLQRKGAAALSDFELLEVMIGSGNAAADVGSIARQIQKVLRRDGAALTIETLTALHGVSSAQAGKLLASFELARRHLVRDVQPLRTQDDIISRLDGIRGRQQEYFVALSLDGGQRLIAQRTITVGTLDTVLAHPREVFSDPLMDRAGSIIVAHNHPSGMPTPSRKDRELTQQLAAAGHLLGVPLRDHIILTKTEAFSFRQHHLL